MSTLRCLLLVVAIVLVPAAEGADALVRIKFDRSRADVVVEALARQLVTKCYTTTSFRRWSGRITFSTVDTGGAITASKAIAAITPLIKINARRALAEQAAAREMVVNPERRPVIVIEKTTYGLLCDIEVARDYFVPEPEPEPAD